MNKTLKRILIISLLIILLLLYLLNASLIIKSIIEYTKLFFTKLFPANFIFFTISTLLIDYGLIELIATYTNFNTAEFYVFFMSIISGFPSGSKYTKELLEKKLLSKESANSLIMASHFPNPLFVLGTVCIKIYLAILLSNLIIFILTKKKNKKITFTYKEPVNFASALSSAINKTLKVIVLIYGSSIFFYLVAVIISKYFILSTYSYILLNGLFDLTKGVAVLSLSNNLLKKALLAIFFISFGGISIHMQVKSIIAGSKIKYKNFLKGRIIATALALIIFLILYNI